MRIVIVFFCIIFVSLGLTLEAQTQRIDTVYFGGKKMLRVITEKGDTAFLDQLNEVSVSSKQQFSSKGGWSAFYYNTTVRFYGYHLRDGYVRGKDEILDMVLDDYRLSVKK